MTGEFMWMLLIAVSMLRGLTVSKTIEELEAEIAALQAQEDALKAAKTTEPAPQIAKIEHTETRVVHEVKPVPPEMRVRPAAQTSPSAWPLEPYLRQAR
jgi:hypothetical protein